MHTNPTTRGRHGRRTLAVIGMATAITLTTALPAFAHATFPKKQNPRGGSGVVGSTPPYAAGSTPKLTLLVPFEQTEPYRGSDDSTVDIKAIVPAGWTNPKCGEARTFAGKPVKKWKCQLIAVKGHRKVLHWFGPQVHTPATADKNSPQLFLFSVKVPSPAVKTTYDGKGKTEGFIVNQKYASGTTEHWIPSAAFRGTPPPGSDTEVAAGLARTVAARKK